MWVELKGGNAGDMDDQNQGGTRRTFRAWNVPVSMILNTPELVDNGNGQFLPARGSAHPEYIDGSMVLVRYECSENSTIVDAIAVYDNRPGGGGFKDPDKRIGTSFERRNVKLFFGAKKKLEIFKEQEPVVRWEVRESPVVENFMRLTYRTIVPKPGPFGEPGWDGNAAEVVRAAIGEIHRFGFDGGPPSSWQFSGVDVSDRNAGDAVTLVYEWIRDPGTAKYAITHPVVDPDSFFLWPPQDKPDGYGNLFVRPPFTTLAWAIETETYQPVWFVIESSVRNDGGWQMLPGLP